MKLIDKLLKKMGYIQASVFSGRGWSNVYGAFSNTAKETVTNDTALSISAFFACVRAVSEDIAKIPLKVYRKEGEYKYEESSHPLYRILQYQPNSEMTAMSFRETRTAQMMGWGNSFAYIARNLMGDIQSLWPLRPDRVRIERDKQGRLVYIVTNDVGGQVKFSDKDILHLHGLGFDGISGYNVISYAAQSMGASIAADKYTGSFFGNGCNQQGNLEHPGNLSKDAQQRLKDQIEKKHAGASNANKILVLEEGMKFSSNTINPEASQLIETRQFNVTDICRWCRVPPSKIADLSRATFSNIEQLNIDYVNDSLTAWMKRWEQELYRKLLTEEEKQQGYYIEHVAEGLLRGDIQTRTAAYSALFDRGVLSVNEIRSKENLNPVEGGDIHLVPLNFTTLDKAGQQDQQNNPDLTDDAVDDMADRIYSHEQNCLHDAKELRGDKFDEVKFYEKFEPKRQRYTKSVLSAYGLSIQIPRGLGREAIAELIRGELCIKH